MEKLKLILCLFLILKLTNSEVEDIIHEITDGGIGVSTYPSIVMGSSLSNQNSLIQFDDEYTYMLVKESKLS
jgi:hypothetical protein